MDKSNITAEDIQTLLSVGGSAIHGTSKAGWEIDAYQLGKAKEYLDLDLTVMVRFTSGKWRRGAHRLRSRLQNGERYYWHHITLSQIWDKEYTNRVLLHELTHAWQQEHWAKETGNHITEWYDKAYNLYAYDKNPWEKHAWQVADEMIEKGWILLNG